MKPRIGLKSASQVLGLYMCTTMPGPRLPWFMVMRVNSEDGKVASKYLVT